MENSQVYLLGGGFNKKLPLVSEELPGLFDPLLEEAEEILKGIDDIIKDITPILDDVGTKLPPVAPQTRRVDGEWIISSHRQWNSLNVSLYLPLKALLQLNDFPYVIRSGNKVRLVGRATDEWEAGTSPFYNPTVGIARKVDDPVDDWFVTVSKVQVNDTPSRPELNLDLTDDQVRSSTPGFVVKDTRPINNQPGDLGSVLDHINRTHDSFQHGPGGSSVTIPVQVSGIAKSQYADYRSWFNGPLDRMLPRDKLNSLLRAMSGLNDLKNSILCFAKCLINTAANIAGAIIGAIGSVSKGGMPFDISITTGDVATLLNCINLGWILDMIMGFLNAILNMIKALWLMLKGLFSMPDCDCSNYGMGLGGLSDFGLDLCGFGIKASKVSEVENEGIGDLDYAINDKRNAEGSEVTEVTDTVTVYKPKPSWSPN